MSRQGFQQAICCTRTNGYFGIEHQIRNVFIDVKKRVQR